MKLNLFGPIVVLLLSLLSLCERNWVQGGPLAAVVPVATAVAEQVAKKAADEAINVAIEKITDKVVAKIEKRGGLQGSAGGKPCNCMVVALGAGGNPYGLPGYSYPADPHHQQQTFTPVAPAA